MPRADNASPPPAGATPAGALNRIRLRHLQCFLAVARHGTLRGAADALSVTQPAVTKTLNELEELLGARLFARGRHGALPTAEAERFLPHAAASVAALAQAVGSVAAGAAPAVLRIGVLPTVSPFLARVLGALGGGNDGAAPHALAQLRVTSGANPRLIELLRTGELDAAVGRLSDPQALVGVTFEHLYAEPMLVAVRPAHPLLAGAAPPLPAALSAWPMVLPLPGTLIRQLADGWLAGHGAAPAAGRIETLDTALARALLQGGGDHLWFTPASAVLADLGTGTLARLALDILPAESIGLLLPADAAPSAALSALLVALRAEAARQRGDAA